MDERQLREVLLTRLHIEMQLFKDSMLQRGKADIYAGSYKIELYINIYEILVILVERMSEQLIRDLLYRPSGILDAFYWEWLNKEDGFYAELRAYVEEELVILTGGATNEGKDDEDGKRQDKVA